MLAVLDTDERLHTRLARLARNAALFGMPALLFAALAITVVIHPPFGDFDLQSLAMGALPAGVRRGGAGRGRDRRAASISRSARVIAVANVLAASTMEHASFGQSLAAGAA